MREPIAVATWPFGLPAAQAAWLEMSRGASALDAAIRGATICEDDPSIDSVGYGGLPDADGEVTLDASVMDHQFRCGAVACLKRVKNAAQAARLVMERTPHVMLVGDAATRFALANGMSECDLLTESSRQRYEEWKSKRQPESRSHDTLGLLTLDAQGHLAGVCTTSGLAFKLPGRVGDSPIIGAGLYVDGRYGAAAATGVGEEMIRCCASHTIVERMRRGRTPEEAVTEVLHDLLVMRRGNPDVDVSFIALRADGQAAGMTLRDVTKFQYAVVTSGGNVINAPSLV